MCICMVAIPKCPWGWTWHGKIPEAVCHKFDSSRGIRGKYEVKMLRVCPEEIQSLVSNWVDSLTR